MNGVLLVGSGLDFSGISLPFTANDLMVAGVALLGFVGTFVLFAMAFKVAPKLITLIMNSFRSGGKA